MKAGLVKHLERIANALHDEDRDDWEHVYRAAARLKAIESVFPGFNTEADVRQETAASESIPAHVKLTKGGLEIEEGQK